MRPLAQALAAGAASAACFCAGDALAAAAAASGFPACDAPVLLSAIPETGLAAEPMALAVGLMAACIPWAVWARSLVRAGTYRQGEEHGSARWGTLKEGRAFMDGKDPANNILLSRDFALALKPKRFDLKHDRNRNVCVLGGPGSGKTRYYVKPNIMQKNADFFVTDPKGTLLGEVGWTLADAGYDIRTFDTTDFSRSMHYNPLAYVSDQADILVFVECLIKNTTADDRKGADPFWENSERLLYTALVAYLVYHARPEERDLNSLMLLLSLAEAREEDESYMSPLDLIFEELETGMRFMERERGREAREERPFDDGGDWGWVRIVEPRDPEEDFALSNYRAFKVAAGKTLKSIIISCNVRLKPLSVDAVSDLVAYDEMALDSLGSGEGKHAIFASMSDSDSTFDFLFALLMWQATSVLYKTALARFGGSLKRPVHFLLDEFGNIGTVPDFERVIATARSRNVSFSIILQSASQLERAYKKEGAKTILDCCDTVVFLGGKSTETNEMVSKMVGKQTVKVLTESDSRGANRSTTQNYNVIERDLMTPDEVGRLPRDESIVLISGTYPLKGAKYRIEEHPSYPEVDPGHAGARHEERFDFKEYRERRGGDAPMR